jgi:hypothetical protein
MIAETTWYLGVLLFAILHVLNFFRLAARAGVFMVFGRKAMPTSSLIYLTLMALVPMLSVLPLINGPFDWLPANGELACAALLTCTLAGSAKLMAWFSMGVVTE